MKNMASPAKFRQKRRNTRANRPCMILLAVATLALQLSTAAAQSNSLAGQPAQQRRDYVPPADGGLGSTLTLDQQGAASEKVESHPIKTLSAHPAEEPRPALKYRFWQPEYKLQPGSALMHFSRALVMWHGFPADFRSKVQQWSFDAGEKSPSAAEMSKAIDQLINIFDELDKLALAEDFKWDHRLRDLSGPSMYMYLMPEVQQSRDLARLIRIRVRYHADHGEFEEAIHALQAGFKLGAFVGQGETLVQQLVGLAVVGIMLNEVEHLITQPDCPNLYWALATLPRPVIDVRESVQFELGAIHRILPALKEAETEQRDAEYWNSAWASLTEDFAALGGLGNESKLAFAVLGVASANPARERLIASGMDREEVEAMAPMRAVLMDASIEIRRVSDDLTKGSFLPHSFGREIVAQADDAMEEWIQQNRFQSGGAAIAGLLFPAVQAAAAAGIRTQFVVNRLMTIEAIRMHAAENGGKAPDSLEELETAPALPNPFSSQPFEYRAEKKGTNQIIALSASDLPGGHQMFKSLQLVLSK